MYMQRCLQYHILVPVPRTVVVLTLAALVSSLVVAPVVVGYKIEYGTCI